MANDQILRLRRGESLRLFDREQKLIVVIQANKEEKYFCWERWVKAVGGYWVNWNKYLSLKDVNNILKDIKKQYDAIHSNKEEAAKGIR